jgi:hypothetical protein
MSDPNMDKIWIEDLLGRRDDAIYLQRFIENSYRMDKAHQNSFVLNINSEWGSGKTWFLKRFAEQLEINHPVVYFDAWKNDFTKDPLTSLIAVICESLQNQFAQDAGAAKKIDVVKKKGLKLIKPSLPVLIAALVKRVAGMDLLDVEENDQEELNGDTSTAQYLAYSLTKIAASETMNEFYTQKQGIEDFILAIKGFVEHLKKHKKLHLPICIFIDELDRCRPTYAIELLEVVKHIFSIGGLFFIIATDSRQLAHSISAVYGQKFDSTAYLRRFFYTEYSLSTVDYEKMADHLFSGVDFGDKLYLPPSYLQHVTLTGYFSLNARFFQLTPREQEQVFINFKHCVATTDMAVIHYAYILFLLSLKLKCEDIYVSFKDSKNSPEYLDFMKRRGVDMNSAVGLALGTNSIQKNPKKFNAQEMVRFYSQLRNESYQDIFQKDLTYMFQREIVRALEIERKDNNENFEELTSLDKYFSLITQAGRLIKKA